MIILKVCIYLPCINTQRQKTAPFDETSVVSSSNHQKTGLYQGSDDRIEGDQNSYIICLLRKSQAIHYCNQSVLAIFPDLNIFIFSITIIGIILRSALVRFSLLRASYLYNSTGLRLNIFFRNQHRVFVIIIVLDECTILILRRYVFKVCAIFFLIQLILKFISIYPSSTHSDEQQPHLTSIPSYHIATTKRQDCIRGQPIVVREIVTPI